MDTHLNIHLVCRGVEWIDRLQEFHLETSGGSHTVFQKIGVQMKFGNDVSRNQDGFLFGPVHITRIRVFNNYVVDKLTVKLGPRDRGLLDVVTGMDDVDMWGL